MKKLNKYGVSPSEQALADVKKINIDKGLKKATKKLNEEMIWGTSKLNALKNLKKNKFTNEMLYGEFLCLCEHLDKKFERIEKQNKQILKLIKLEKEY